MLRLVLAKTTNRVHHTFSRSLSDILFTKVNQTAVVTLNRPKKLNTITTEMMWDLNAIVRRAIQDNTVKLLILNGSGDNFSAGGDLEGDQFT